MDVRFGVHAGLQHTSIAELRELWARIETLGFEWISIWDHFYAADATGDPHCLEAVTTHAALAASTRNVRCGSLVYSAGYRHPAVLANTMATLDQIADGRVVLGLGGGWLEQEYQVYGLHYGSAGERLRMLGEYVQCVRGLLTQERTSFAGEFFTLTDAQCEPKPVQATAAHLDRRGRREGHAQARRATRRRLERPVHPARRVGAQGEGARRPLRRGRTRSRRHREDGQRRHGVHRGGADAAVRPDGQLREAGRAVGQRAGDGRQGRRLRRGRRASGSSSRCARRSTATASSGSRPRWCPQFAADRSSPRLAPHEPHAAVRRAATVPRADHREGVPAVEADVAFLRVSRYAGSDSASHRRSTGPITAEPRPSPCRGGSTPRPCR